MHSEDLLSVFRDLIIFPLQSIDTFILLIHINCFLKNFYCLIKKAQYFHKEMAKVKIV